MPNLSASDSIFLTVSRLKMRLQTWLFTLPHGEFNRRWPWDLEAKRTCNLTIWTEDPVLPVPLQMSIHRTPFTTIQRTLSFTTPFHIHLDLASLQHSTGILSHSSPDLLGTSSLPWPLVLLGNPILQDARINMPIMGSHMRCNWLNCRHGTPIHHLWWFIAGKTPRITFGLTALRPARESPHRLLCLCEDRVFNIA